jgi:(+)-neomenthol dehydrogenase
MIMKNVCETVDAAKEAVQTNYYGTKHVIEALLPLLQSSSEGRIVNVSSNYGLLTASSVHQSCCNIMPQILKTIFLKEIINPCMQVINNDDVRHELNDIDSLTEKRLDELLEKFLMDFEAGALEVHGWPIGLAAYKMAKVAMNAYSRILAKRRPELCINCAHPGFVKTDMNMRSGVLMPEEGARNVVKVALLPDGGPTGVYFAEGEESSFL